MTAAPRCCAFRQRFYLLYFTTWGGLAYESQPFAKKVASALALFAPLGTKAGAKCTRKDYYTAALILLT